MSWVAILVTGGSNYFLRSTIWTADAARAERFPTEEAAKAGLEKAKKFMQKSTAKKAVIREWAE